MQLNNNVVSLLRTGILTAIGAFTGAIATTGGMPQTAAEWKAMVMPALGAAFAAEITFIKLQANKALQDATTQVTQLQSKLAEKEPKQ
jgi:hypothetical protein